MMFYLHAVLVVCSIICCVSGKNRVTLFELLRSQTNNANTKENGEFQIGSDFEIISSGCCFLSNQKRISSISGRKAFEVDLTT